MSEQETSIITTEEYVAPFPAQATALAAGELHPASRAAATMMGSPSDNAQAATMALTAMATVELQMKMAMSYPRRLDEIHGLLARSCANPEFADVALYSFPKGGKAVTGPSIKMAEEMARLFGHVASGFFIVMDSEDQRTVRAWAWDLQNNYRRESDITFAKSIQRRQPNGATEWIKPDEKDLQMLTMSKASIGIRNMILTLIPDQLKRDCVSWCRQTLAKKDAEDPDRFKRNLIAVFARLGVTAQQLVDLAGKDIGSIRAPADNDLVEYLRGIKNRLDRGESSIHDVIAERAEMLGLKGPPPQTTAELRRLVNEAANPTPRRRNSTTEV